MTTDLVRVGPVSPCRWEEDTKSHSGLVRCISKGVGFFLATDKAPAQWNYVDLNDEVWGRALPLHLDDTPRWICVTYDLRATATMFGDHDSLEGAKESVLNALKERYSL